MTVVEIALAIVLVAGAGWLVRGFASLRSTDLGFVADKRLIFDVSFLGPKYPNRRRGARGVARRCSTRLAALPGVTAVGATSNFPLRNTPEGSLIAAVPRRAGRPGASDRHAPALRQPGILRGRPARRLLQGRDFGPDDRAGHHAGRDRQQDVRQALSRGPRSDRPAVLRRLPRARSAQRSDWSSAWSTTCGRRAVSDEAEPAFYSPLAQVPLRRQTMVVATSLTDVATLQSADPRRSAPLRSADRRGIRAGHRSGRRHDPPAAARHDADADLRRSSRSCSRRSASTASSPTRCRSGAARWRRAWRSARRPAACSGW